jgi:Heparinase II/III-like protein/Heparinase II/III N-terminus
MTADQVNKKTVRGKMRRIAAMGRAEIAERVRQEVRKRADAILCALGVELTRGEILEGVRGGSRNSSGEGVPRGRFFFDAADVPRRLNLLRERMPEQVEGILKRAEQICRHRFDLLGHEDVDYGADIDWHLDGVHGKRAPNDLWFRIRYLDFAAVGDAKVTWELNRHQHLVTLAEAYRFTGDLRFATELVAQWRDWGAKNTYPRGINWASSLEVAHRSLSWLWVYFLLDGTPAMTREFAEEWLRAMALHGRHIERYLSTYFSPNTHLLGEGVALFFIGTLCPKLRSAARWKTRGWEIVLRESERQIRADGFHFEQSTYYHVYALDFFLHARVLASLNGVPFPAEFDHRVGKMLVVLAVLRRAGNPPRFGDDDGGRVFDPRRNRAEHLGDPLATGAVLFGRGDFKFRAGGLREETIWLLGEKGVAEFDRGEATEASMSSVALAESGMYVMSDGERNLQAVIDAGPQGAFKAGHGHADALSMTVHADGFELIGDPGTYQYVGAGNERDRFRATASHNTVEVDGRSQSEPDGPFGWKSLTNTSVEKWITVEQFDLFVGSHDGYSSLNSEVIHRRWVFFLKPQFWMVRDVVTGTDTHQIDVRWHLNPGLRSSGASGDTFSSFDERSSIAIFGAVEHGWQKTVEEGMYSPVYGAKEPATTVRFSAKTALPAEFATLLLPAGARSEGLAEHAKFGQVSASPEISVYRFSQNGEEHHFVFAPDKLWAFEKWKSDAEFLYFSRIAGKLKGLVFCNGTELAFDESTLLRCGKRVLRCEVYLADGKPQISASEKEISWAEEAINRLFTTGESLPGADR